MMFRRTHLLFVLAALLLLGGVMGWTHQPVVLAEPANYDCATQSAIPETECEALVAIYNANPDADLSGWLADGSSPCSWGGVFCSEDMIVELGLGFSGIMILPAEIVQLSNLQRLYLNDNQLTALPAEIGQLHNLERLDLAFTQLTAVPPELGQLSNLEYLDLSMNPLVGPVPEFLTNLQLLQEFDFSETDWCVPPTGPVPTWLNTIPWWTGSGLTCDATYDCAAQGAIPETECEALVAIYNANSEAVLSGWLEDGSSPCDWEGVVCLEGVVIEIWLFDSQLTILPPQIEQLSNVLALYLSSNQLTAVPPELGQLNSLQQLHLNSNQLAIIPTTLWQLSNLQYLDLSYNGFTTIPDGIELPSNLRWLGLSGNQLTTLPSAIGQLSHLTGITLEDNQFTSVPPELWELTNLQSLSLSANQLTSIPIELGQLSNLRSLHLGVNQLTSIPSELGQLSNLQYLYLYDNQLTAVPTEIGQLGNLTTLHLSDNPLTEVPTEIWQLSNLQSLGLSNIQLTAVPSVIGELSNLQWLNLLNNQLCALPETITNLTPSWGLFVSGNHLAPTDPNLIVWLNSYDPYWADPQTPCPFIPSVVLSAPTDALDMGTGQTVTYTVHITNTGDAHDIFTLTATNHAWTTSLPNSVSLAEGATDSFAVQVHVPLTATHGAQDSVSITAVSSISETVTSMISLTPYFCANRGGLLF